MDRVIRESGGVKGLLSESLGSVEVCTESQACDFFAIHGKQGNFLDNHNVLDF